ncbi:MAG TPA: GAF domain-containing protein [Pyrinomonadaceae bacterium]|nr:GAF domain-containing protein [Pyrinomonadaceae bacterium]
MVNGHLEDSLRREIESYLEGRLSAVKQEITSLQSLLNESLSTFLDRQADVQMEGSLVASISEHLRAAHERGVELAASESSRAKASSDMAIVKSAIAEINEQKSQADILKALVNRASSFAPRVAFFVVKGEQATGWRGRGFEGTVGDETIQQISMPLSSDTVVSSAARGLSTWSGGPGSHADDHALLNRLGEQPPQRIVAIPLVVRGRAVAVLYADSAGLDSESINLEALETLVTVAGMAVELLSVSRTAAKKASEAEPSPAPAEEVQSSYEPSSEYAEPAAPVAAEPSFSGADTVQNYETSYEPTYEQTYEPTPVEPEAFVEAAPVEEPAGVFEDTAAPAETPAPSEEPPEWNAPAHVAPVGASRRRYGQDAELPVEVYSEEERRLHNDARRFARLLISEIKLYNEQKVAEGRTEHDLYDRLREYIDRSREMYDKRVKAEVAARYDYFHGELVNTLAEGDVSKLGANYPGATVNA